MSRAREQNDGGKALGHGVVDLPGEPFALFQTSCLVLARGKFGLGGAQLPGYRRMVRCLSLHHAPGMEGADGKGRADEGADGRRDGPFRRMLPGGQEGRQCP